MTEKEKAREAPAPTPLDPGVGDDAFPAATEEPVLKVDDIQGNILGGFNKNHQLLVFLRIDDPAKFKPWLRDLVPRISTSAQVITFNRLYKHMRSKVGKKPCVIAKWTNIAFSHQGLRKLGAIRRGKDFHDAAFRQGLAHRSRSLNDPKKGQRGSPGRWKVGGPRNEADVVIIVASDLDRDLNAAVSNLMRIPGAMVLFDERGHNFTKDMAGHEHFGFLDGISQPGIRGRLSRDYHDLFTPHRNPDDPNQGKPGQDLLWPGEFVFGYPGQTGKTVEAPGRVKNAGPRWAENGSFLVFRRLSQDVGTFHRFLSQEAKKLGLSPDELGAKLVGRWRSGAPILRAPTKDDRDLADDDCANNHFEFNDDTEHIKKDKASSIFHCTDARLPRGLADPDGEILPLAGHIRRAYPRDDESRDKGSEVRENLNEPEVQTHRLLRRGIPFGKKSPSKLRSPRRDAADRKLGRGLHFLAYMTSIENQFEFVIKSWVNNPDFKEPGAGHDPVIGQSKARNRLRKFKVTFMKNGKPTTEELKTTTDWVIPTGGGYFFAPSLSALKIIAKSK